MQEREIAPTSLAFIYAYRSFAVHARN